MGQSKKELIALKSAGLRKGGKPAKPNAKVVEIGSKKMRILATCGRIKAIGNRVMVVKS